VHFNITKKNDIADKSFRVAQLYDQFDLNEDSFEEHFEGDIGLEREWQIGVIAGKSGTGKSTIARELFAGYFFTPKYKAKCVIDDFPKMESAELFGILSSVGFSSPPSWLKPYAVLSNGEKMRVDLARAICEKKDVIVMEYHYTRGLVRRPEIKIEIYEARGFWEVFRRYHYLMHNIHAGSKQYVAFYNGKPVGFAAYLHMPQRSGNIMHGHRLVVLPDYQGIGLAKKLQNMVARELSKKYNRIGFVTSQKGFAKSCIRDPNWKLIHLGRQSGQRIKTMRLRDSSSRNTYSFRWTGGNADAR
jgi:GNAT superfamily N-acetyltransferase